MSVESISSPSTHYDSQPDRAFWRRAVAGRHVADLVDLWQPTVSLGPGRRILTAGSCFAQHIGRALQARRYDWRTIDPHLTDNDATSLPTGNIYTAAMLRQWLDWATGTTSPPDLSWQRDARVVDPFRPTLPAKGFASVTEMLAARQRSLARMAEGLAQADLFIFTLGLTEAWRDRRGWLYPLCPGTAGGRFDPVDHIFHNYTTSEIEQDLRAAIDILRALNPDMDIILTVSPVPLIATATDRHVLVATTESKSVLRAAAGTVCRDRDRVDYFPSYELITAAISRGRFFAADQRSVTAEGVETVMGHFFRGFGEEVSLAPTPIEPTPSPPAEDVVCEEILLDPDTRHRDTDEPPRLLLIGDSQIGCLARELNRRRIPFAGGGLMNACRWSTGQFNPVVGSLYSALEAEDREAWQRVLNHLVRWKLSLADLPIVTNIGCHAHHLFQMFKRRLGATRRSDETAHPTAEQAVAIIDSLRTSHYRLLAGLCRMNPAVHWLPDPLISAEIRPFQVLAESHLSQRIQQFGALTVDTGKIIGDRGQCIPTAYRDPKDPIHGLPAYYQAVADHLLALPSMRSPRTGLAVADGSARGRTAP